MQIETNKQRCAYETTIQIVNYKLRIKTSAQKKEERKMRGLKSRLDTVAPDAQLAVSYGQLAILHPRLAEL